MTTTTTPTIARTGILPFVVLTCIFRFPVQTQDESFLVVDETETLERETRRLGVRFILSSIIAVLSLTAVVVVVVAVVTTEFGVSSSLVQIIIILETLKTRSISITLKIDYS